MNYTNRNLIRTALLLLGLALLVMTGSGAVWAQMDDESAAGADMTEAQANVVEVGLAEFEIDMPASIPAGPTAFEVTEGP